MRLLIFLLPLALAAPSDLTKRNTLGFLENIFNQGELSLIVNTLSKSLGTNETEQACEEECHILIKQNHLLQHACPLVCHSLQELVHQLAPASRRSIFTDAYQKLLGMFDIEHLKQVVHQMFSKLGSDPTEALCETTCHAVITMDHLLQHGCPLVCHSFQELVSHFHLGSTDAPVVKRSYGTAENKRFLLDSVNLGNFLNAEELKVLVTGLVNTVGSDATEAACETECRVLIKTDHVLQYVCPLVCHSLQEIAHQLTPASRRSIFTDAYQKLLGMFDLEHLKQVVHQMSAKLGSDPTEALCETTCHAVITMDHLLQHGCPLVCHSFQELVNHFHLGSTDAPVVKRSYGTAENKRFLLDSVNLGNFLNAEELNVLVTGLVNTVGSDATEAACETECHVLIKTDHVLQYVCPLVCHSLQEIAHQLAPASRRSIFTDTFQKLLGMFDLEHLKQVVHQMFSKLGSDPTEALCETTCHAVIAMDHLLQHGCPLVCHSFQELVHHFDIGNTQGSSTPISLRSKPFAS